MTSPFQADSQGTFPSTVTISRDVEYTHTGNGNYITTESLKPLPSVLPGTTIVLLEDGTKLDVVSTRLSQTHAAIEVVAVMSMAKASELRGK